MALFTAEDEDLLGALCSQAAIALDNARLFEEVVAMKNYNESILRSMATGVITLDPDGQVTTINPAARRILDLGEAERSARDYGEAISCRANADLAAAIAAASWPRRRPQEPLDRRVAHRRRPAP